MIYYYRYLFVKMKVFNYSELHFSAVTSYKILTLVQLKLEFYALFYPVINVVYELYLSERQVFGQEISTLF